ncbi:MAG: ATP-binding protein [Bryobacterales bacterium]|nr:ATP-binding protein [Bryobacterales bacterium]
MRTHRLSLALFFLALALGSIQAPFLLAQNAGDGGVAQRVGVPVDGGYTETTARWLPTVRYLESEIRGTRFTLTPVPADKLLASVQRGEVEFAIVPPGRYPALELHAYASAIASAATQGIDGETVALVRGSLLALKDRTDLTGIASAKGKKVLALGADSLAGWIGPSVRLRAAGIDPEADLPDLRFANDANTVFDALNSGVVDIAALGNGELIAAMRRGKIKLADYRVLQESTSTPMDAKAEQGSTPAFPMEAFVKSASASNALAQKVADALYRMNASNGAGKSAMQAAGNFGWTVPQNYAAVAADLRAAGLDPELADGGSRAEESFFNSKYWPITIGFLVAIIATISAVLQYRRMRAHVKTTEETLDAAKQDLAQSQQALTRSGEIRASLLSNFRQDFRTPLSALLEISRLLRTTQLSSAQAEYVNAIREMAHNLMGSIGNVTDFASLEAGALRTEKRDFDLMEVVDNAVLNVYEQMGEHFAELSVQVDTQVYRWLNGDPGRLRQVLQNLLHNAMKFTRSGDVLLHISREEDQPEAASVRFTVIDTGVGMDAKQVKKVFEPYVVEPRGKQTSRGLGLPLCKRLVELLGGKISADSASGKGSQFSFVLPFRKQAQAAVMLDDDVSRIKESRILLIGGREIARRILQYYLHSWGAQVVYADRFESSLDVMRAEAENGQKFDAVLCPAFVADRNAVELVATVRDHPELDGIPFVVIASRQECEALPQLEQLAGLIRIERPVRRGDLVIKMGEALRLEVPDRLWKDPSDYDREEIYKLDIEFSDSKIKRGSILVADSNPIHQRAVALVLDRMGYNVDTTISVAETAKRLQSQRYDLAFLETRLTDGDTFKLVGELRGRENKAMRVPIIGMLAEAQDGEREHCLLSGMDDSMLKPLDMETIARTIRRWTRKQPQRQNAVDAEMLQRELSA